MARRTEPAAVKAQKAAVRSTRKPPVETEQDAPESGLKAPKWLTGEGLQIWTERGPVLRQMRLLQAPDEPAFARYCRDFALWLKLRKELDDDGYTYDADTTHGGKLRRADPSFLIADRIERQLLAVEDRFGMNPSERQRLIAQRANRAGELPLEPVKEGAAPAAKPAGSPIGMLSRGQTVQ